MFGGGKDIGYNIQVSKQTSAMGAEVVTITAKAPKDASGEDIDVLMQKMFLGIDRRLSKLNDVWQARKAEIARDPSKKNLEELENEGEDEFDLSSLSGTKPVGNC